MVAADESIKDEYFLELNQDFVTTKGISYNKNISINELRFYQTLGMSLFYLVQFITKPFRFFKFLKAILGRENPTTIFAKRISENIAYFSGKRYGFLRETKMSAQPNIPIETNSSPNPYDSNFVFEKRESE